MFLSRAGTQFTNCSPGGGHGLEVFIIAQPPLSRNCYPWPRNRSPERDRFISLKAIVAEGFLERAT
jgi:hypothetical protein